MVAGHPGVSGQPVQGHVEAESRVPRGTVIIQCKFLLVLLVVLFLTIFTYDQANKMDKKKHLISYIKVSSTPIYHLIALVVELKF